MLQKKTDDLQDPTPATHGDLGIWGGELTTRIEKLQNEVGEFKTQTNEKLTRIERKIDKLFTHIDKRIDHYVENRASDLLGVKHDAPAFAGRPENFGRSPVKNHEQRITVLER